MDRLTVQPYSSTNPENLVKIGQVDFEITGQKEMVKDEYKTRNSSRTYRPPGLLSRILK